MPGHRGEDHRHVEVALVVGREHHRTAEAAAGSRAHARSIHAKTRASGRIHVARLARRIQRTTPCRFHDGKSTGSATVACRGARAEISGPQFVERSWRRRTSSRRCASGTDPRAPPSAPRVRASSGPGPRATWSPPRSRAPANRVRTRLQRIAAGVGAAAGARAGGHPRRDGRALQLARALGARQRAGRSRPTRCACAGDRRASRWPRAPPPRDRRPARARARRARARWPPSVAADHRRFRTPSTVVRHALHVVGEHVEALGRDDHLLLAPADEQPPLRVQLADVAGVQPALGVDHAAFGRGLGLGLEAWVDSRLPTPDSRPARNIPS